MERSLALCESGATIGRRRKSTRFGLEAAKQREVISLHMPASDSLAP